MDQPSLSRDSQVVLLLASHLGSTPDEGETGSGLGPAGWRDFATQIKESSLESPGDLLQDDPEEWPDDIWTTHATREWVRQRLSQSTKLAMELEDLNNRGIWVTTLYEPSYPERLLDTLDRKAPPFFYIAGEPENLQTKAVGFVGSREADEADKGYTRQLVEKVSDDGFGIVSGGAKGIDETSESAGLEAGAPVVEFPTEGIQNCITEKETREAIVDGNLTLVSHYHPKTSWSVGAAMGRNKLIHGFANYTVVVRSGHETGGTWKGATENLEHQWSPLFVCTHGETPEGNRALLENGAIPLDLTSIPEKKNFEEWVQSNEETAYGTSHRASDPSSEDDSGDETGSKNTPGENETEDSKNHQSSLDRFR